MSLTLTVLEFKIFVYDLVYNDNTNRSFKYEIIYTSN